MKKVWSLCYHITIMRDLRPRISKSEINFIPFCSGPIKLFVALSQNVSCLEEVTRNFLGSKLSPLRDLAAPLKPEVVKCPTLYLR